MDLLENMFKNPWSKDSKLTSVSAGIEVTSEVRSNLQQAKEKELAAYKKFIEERCSSDSTIDYFDPLKKQKLKTFRGLKTVSKISIKGRALPLQVDRTLFARMAVLGQFRQINIKTVFTFPLGYFLMLLDFVDKQAKRKMLSNWKRKYLWLKDFLRMLQAFMTEWQCYKDSNLSWSHIQCCC